MTIIYQNDSFDQSNIFSYPNNTPGSKVHGANMGSIWVLPAPDGPHVGPINLAIRDSIGWTYTIHANYHSCGSRIIVSSCSLVLAIFIHIHCLLGNHIITQLSVKLIHWGRDKFAAFSRTTFWNAFSRMKMYELCLRFHWPSFLRSQSTIFQHWFR